MTPTPPQKHCDIVTLLTAVGDLIPNKPKPEPLKNKCPYCKVPMRWEQFKEIWICREHGKFDEGVVK